MSPATRSLLSLLFLAAGATALLAHDLFIKPDSWFVPADTRLRIPVLNGTFTGSENGIAPDRIADLSVVSPQGRAQLDLEAWSVAGDTSWLRLRTGGAGTYVVGVSTRPNRIELTGEQFNQYLEHDGIPDVLAARRAAGQLEAPARERYGKHVKAVLQVGDALTSTFGAALGYPAELVALDNPYAPGEEPRFRAVVDGRPVANQYVVWGGLDAAGAPIAERATRTDSGGVARIRIDRPGKRYVKFIHMRRIEEPRLDYESKWATLTFERR